MVILLDLGGVVFDSKGRSNDKIDWDLITQLNEKYALRMNLGENTFPDFILNYNLLTKQNLTGDEFLELIF